LDDLTHVIFIDFEYTSWNPRAMDIANYFNETMLDNAHPVGTGIKWYLQNFINKEEQDKLMRIYLNQYFTTYSDQKEKVEKNVFIEESMPKLRSEVNRCL
jgi:thiamine kinase-like enzyme